MTNREKISDNPLKRSKSSRRLKSLGKGVKDLLGGEALKTGTFRFFPFLVLIALLAFLYIANNYLAENKIRRINDLRKEVKELRYEYITSKSELTDLTKQSQLSRKLQKKGIRESTEPIKVLKKDN